MGRVRPDINAFATPVSNDRIMVTGLVINEIYVASTQIVHPKQDGRVRMLEGSISGLARATSKGGTALSRMAKSLKALRCKGVFWF